MFNLCCSALWIGASLVVQMIKNLPAMLETHGQSLGREDPLEKGMATHFSILPCRIPWIEEPGRLYSPWHPKESDMNEAIWHTHKIVFISSNFLKKKRI